MLSPFKQYQSSLIVKSLYNYSNNNNNIRDVVNTSKSKY